MSIHRSNGFHPSLAFAVSSSSKSPAWFSTVTLRKAESTSAFSDALTLFADTTRLKVEQDKTSSLMHVLHLQKISEKEYILVKVGYAHPGISITLSNVGIMWGSIAHQFLSMWPLQWDSDIAPEVCRLVQTWWEKLCYWLDILNVLLIFIFRYTS